MPTRTKSCRRRTTTRSRRTCTDGAAVERAVVSALREKNQEEMISKLVAIVIKISSQSKDGITQESYTKAFQRIKSYAVRFLKPKCPIETKILSKMDDKIKKSADANGVNQCQEVLFKIWLENRRLPAVPTGTDYEAAPGMMGSHQILQALFLYWIRDEIEKGLDVFCGTLSQQINLTKEVGRHPGCDGYPSKYGEDFDIDVGGGFRPDV
jgi:hypothetical protein